ncbi:MAG: acyl transferase [Marinoscillum sp.]
MFNYENFKSEIFFIQPSQLDQLVLEVFEYQYQNNSIYRAFCQHLNKHPENISNVMDIPFLPIELFKTKKVVTGSFEAEKIFKSSGTTGIQRSTHHIKNVSFYHHLAKVAFEGLYGSISQFEVMALLPSYQQQGNSSLISMVDTFMQDAKPGSTYYLNDLGQLKTNLQKPGKKILFGVSYALLDLATTPVNTQNLIVIETGGMKGRRKEMIRKDLHSVLKQGLGLDEIHSEYGMTELTSQAYGINGNFKLPNWSKILIRDINDPFTYLANGQTGGINIIDLGNIDSCAFIETQDLGKMSPNGTFEVLGRFDNSDIRGCNLLI